MTTARTKQYVEFSTANLVDRDHELLGPSRLPTDGSLEVMPYRYGYIVSILGFNNTTEQAQYLGALRAWGYSEQFCEIIQVAWQNDADLIRFDRDTCPMADLTTY